MPDADLARQLGLSEMWVARGSWPAEGRFILMRTARQILVNPPDPPYRGSVPLINAMLRDVLHDLGYETSCVWRPAA